MGQRLGGSTQMTAASSRCCVVSHTTAQWYLDLPSAMSSGTCLKQIIYTFLISKRANITEQFVTSSA